jgi:hypothetical protein
MYLKERTITWLQIYFCWPSHLPRGPIHDNVYPEIRKKIIGTPVAMHK